MTSKFSLLNEDSGARLGQIKLKRGIIDTPTFMPVGTAATVKALTVDQINQTNSQIILCNTYHLYLRPGTERIERLGGLHKFMNFNKPILTDSGGFQVMSLSKNTKINEDGAIFNSHIDGKKIFISPEISIDIQKKLNSDILMVFDECPEYTKDKDRIRDSMNLSIRWANRSKKEFGLNSEKMLFGIVQGGVFNDLRKECLSELLDINFDGYSLGGLAVGESQDEMFETVEEITPFMDKNKPRYLMGTGTPGDLIGAVKRGIDMFDCVLPTRTARNGLAFTWNGKVNLRNSKYTNDDSPLDTNVNCPASNLYSRNYLNHLLNCNEILASTLITWHNIAFYQDLMLKIRESIKNGKFNEFYKQYFNLLNY
ncbi:tRNA guanosine(34) transglycosylase Tgt [Pelagibacteraceae bacterium]|nr:tRNA guanosine(34) transglycosylase Tgt [Pelagibacteraceae bacterium]